MIKLITEMQQQTTDKKTYRQKYFLHLQFSFQHLLYVSADGLHCQQTSLMLTAV